MHTFIRILATASLVALCSVLVLSVGGVFLVPGLFARGVDSIWPSER